MDRSLQYSFAVTADLDGGYVISFPDLPGCMTQVEALDEVGSTAEEIRRLWIESAYSSGMPIPMPSRAAEYSGKFNLRLPKSLHRQLAESAVMDGVSLNQYVVTLLARRDVEARAERLLGSIETRLAKIDEGVHRLSPGRPEEGKLRRA